MKIINVFIHDDTEERAKKQMRIHRRCILLLEKSRAGNK